MATDHERPETSLQLCREWWVVDGFGKIESQCLGWFTWTGRQAVVLDSNAVKGQGLGVTLGDRGMSEKRDILLVFKSCKWESFMLIVLIFGMVMLLLELLLLLRTPKGKQKTLKGRKTCKEFNKIVQFFIKSKISLITN